MGIHLSQHKNDSDESTPQSINTSTISSSCNKCDSATVSETPVSEENRMWWEYTYQDCPFFSLPREVKLMIFYELCPTSLCSAACVCRDWKNIADSDVLWKRFYRQHDALSNNYKLQYRDYFGIPEYFPQRDKYCVVRNTSLPFKQVRFLVVGNTGVGKATFIRSFFGMRTAKIVTDGEHAFQVRMLHNTYSAGQPQHPYGGVFVCVDCEEVLEYCQRKGDSGTDESVKSVTSDDSSISDNSLDFEVGKIGNSIALWKAGIESSHLAPPLQDRTVVLLALKKDKLKTSEEKDSVDSHLRKIARALKMPYAGQVEARAGLHVDLSIFSMCQRVLEAQVKQDKRSVWKRNFVVRFVYRIFGIKST